LGCGFHSALGHQVRRASEGELMNVFADFDLEFAARQARPLQVDQFAFKLGNFSADSAQRAGRRSSPNRGGGFGDGVKGWLRIEGRPGLPLGTSVPS
jgi:hypothetical protein